MDSGESRGLEDDANEGRAADAVVERWVADSNETFKRAASIHQSWARAVGADAGLGQRLASIANISPSSLTPDAQKLSDTVSKLAPEVRRSMETLISRIDSRALDSLSGDMRGRLTKSLEGLAALSPRYDEVFREIVARPTISIESLLPDLRQIQRSLNLLNRPATTRETQRFITSTDDLRFRGNQRVWHYTSAGALDQILKRHVLWASSPHHLNDASELTHGVETVRLAVERVAERPDGPRGSTLEALRAVTEESFIAEAMHEIHYISASTASDSLTLWRNYSTTDGFAIGLRPGRALSAEGLLFQDSEVDANAELPTVAGWYRVHYAEAKKNALADSFVISATEDITAAGAADGELVVRELRKHLLILASTLKHRAFEDEREVRWITTNWAPVDVIHYEVTGRGFVPVLHARSAGSTDEAPFLPISGVRCSPTTSPTIERTIRGLLKQRGYEDAVQDVRKSALPFRG